MEFEMITLKCPNCGKEIQVPADLESFSCLYCGAKHRMAELMKPAPAADQRDRDYVEEHLLDCVRDFPDYFKQFNRKKYEAAYQAHLEAIRPTYEAMDRWVCAQPARREALLESFADSFLDQWERFQQSRRGRKRMEFSDKLTLAMFTVPAIRELGLSVSEDYVRLLHQRFNEKYPDNRFEPGTHAEISGGFRKHGFCFITTAVCEAEGKPDDCPELTAFRAFRDGWLSGTEEGRALVREYYELAPAIVAAMRYGDDEAAQCARLRRDWLDPCFRLLQQADYPACRDKYKAMVRALQDKYM